MASIRATFRSALDRMKEEPDFMYSFSTPAVFEWIEQVDPALFEEIKERVREGRWDIEAEGWWLQPDCNLPNGESLIRQELYGQRYLAQHFGKRAHTMFNIDSFGHSAMLPQILQKGGIRYYVFTRPSAHEMKLNDNLFEWQSADGSSVLTYRSGSNDAAGSYPQILSETIGKWRSILPDLPHDMMQVFGVTDHGGAPTKQAIADIRAAMEAGDEIHVRFAGTGDFFAAQKEKFSSIVSGELPTKDYGPAVNCTEIKRNNRLGEYALARAERAALLAGKLLNKPYPKEKIRSAWKDLMFNQFHDILGGCCIPDAFVDARNLHGRLLQTANEITHFSLQSICSRIQTLGDNQESVWNICLFNLNGSSYQGMAEAEVQWAWEFPWYQGGIELVDENGTVTPAQIITEKSVIPGFRTRFCFKAEVPAMGWKTYAVRKTGQQIQRTWADNGVQSPFKFYVYEDFGDTWCFNTENGYGAPCEAPELVERKTVESGDLLTTICQIWRFRTSQIEEYFTVYADDPRIDYRYRVNWNEHNKVLKLIPSDISAQGITASIPAGSIRREMDGREYPVNEWLHCENTQGGVTFLLDGISAYDTEGDALRFSLLRSPLFGDLRIAPLDERQTHPFMEQGIHEGRIALIPAALSNSEAANLAAHWISPPITVCEANHSGTLPASQCLLNFNGNAVLSALKQAEDNDDTILRLIEMNGETESTDVTFNDHCAKFAIHPFEIKTIRIDSEGLWHNNNLLEENEE